MRQHIISIVERHVGRGKHTGGSHIMFMCPFHKDEHPSFGVNVDMGVFNCFSCHRHGTVIKLLKLLGLPDHVIDAETKDIRAEIEDNRQRLKWKKKTELATCDPHLATTVLQETLIRPYLYAPDGQGGSFRILPNKLTDAGFDSRWLDYMEIGYDRHNNRITYPIRDLYGNLAGVAGGAAFAGQYPKYKVYMGKRRDHNGKWWPSDYGPEFDEKYPEYDFSNHRFLWNYDQVYPRLFFGKGQDSLIIVEGYKACLWMLQHGYWNTVALMGSAMSETQCSLIHRLRNNIILFLDNDKSGRDGAKSIGKVLRKQQPGVFIAHYPYAEDCQPDDLHEADLTASITGMIPYPQWIKGDRK